MMHACRDPGDALASQSLNNHRDILTVLVAVSELSFVSSTPGVQNSFARESCRVKTSRGDVYDPNALKSCDHDRFCMLLLISDAQLAELSTPPSPDLLTLRQHQRVMSSARDFMSDALLYSLDHLGSLPVGLVAMPQLPEIASAPRKKISSLNDHRGMEATSRHKSHLLALKRLHKFRRSLPNLITMTKTTVLTTSPCVKLSIVDERTGMVPAASYLLHMLALKGTNESRRRDVGCD
mmetsp:Transcript_4207/g.15504  ORF Transcript_4207/g.15504 Transcript_4207/m.15504 type:complete len:237 (+) Transcript_4207:1368-2078(+)